MEAENPELLPEGYYVANYHALAGFVQRVYQDLLTKQESAWYETISDCPIEVQRLYIRLITRKGSVFRLSKLQYPEVGPLSRACEALASRGLIDPEPPSSLSILVAAFTKPELIKLLQLTAHKNLSRVELVDTIITTPEPRQVEYQRILQEADYWITVKGHEYWELYKLCFFGNLYQDSTEFVLRDIGAVTYESYVIDALSRVFLTRDQLDAHLRYFECVALYDSIDVKKAEQLNWVLTHLPQPIHSDLNLTRRLDRFRNKIARQFERLDDTDRALQLYEQSSLPPSRERRARIFIAKGNSLASQIIVNRMNEDPFGEAESQVAGRLQRQINKAAGLAVVATPRFHPKTIGVRLPQSGQRVEQEAVSYYQRFGLCFYTENVLVNAVLGLFIWDIIFHPVPGVFFNPFQSAPTDFREPTFAATRQKLLEVRFGELNDSESFISRVLSSYVSHQGKSNPLVRWGRLPIELLTIALERIPTSHWHALFKRLLADLRENTSGLPDLVLFRDGGGYEFIEIKGPGDVVQQNQRRWMRYFDEEQIPFCVVNVCWAATIDGTQSNE